MRNESLVRIWLKRAKSNSLETPEKVFDWVRKIIEDYK
jgi:hypothetical protein